MWPILNRLGPVSALLFLLWLLLWQQDMAAVAHPTVPVK
ncbi:hypothetical protein L195_g056949 [Trifolium pratense]|uniref:Uncharacterized protein n=1 Tax=Trifolium pratense TaxID=57577 RepID=A0A2K3KUA3_TRIPR|nr:hypothetical protein L195_g056949 [Trifolium pratense]